MPKPEVSSLWALGVGTYLAASLDRLLDFANTAVQWKIDASTINHSFVRFALPIIWDFAEGNPVGDGAGSYHFCYERICTALDAIRNWHLPETPTEIRAESAIDIKGLQVDVVVTDPPYYDSIPYSDLMEFFYVWLRRNVNGLLPEMDRVFNDPLGPKWNSEKKDGELIDDASRFGGNNAASKTAYEDGMFRAFQACDRVLAQDGRMVVVFANKSPDAWETLVSAIVRAGFVVDASWPIQTEQPSRTRGQSSAALASSVWIIAKRRSETARPGWDNRVLQEMRENIYSRLREYWDAGIRGPDFVWAATGPALEAYSQHPVVNKADEPGKLLEVSDFLRAVRRIVVDFVVGRVLSHNEEAAAVSGLDDVTTYYLLHRHDFGMEDAPVGACILYAISCGLSDHDLADRYEILLRTGGQSEPDEDEEPESPADERGRRRERHRQHGAPSAVEQACPQEHGLRWGWQACPAD